MGKDIQEEDKVVSEEISCTEISFEIKIIPVGVEKIAVRIKGADGFEKEIEAEGIEEEKIKVAPGRVRKIEVEDREKGRKPKISVHTPSGRSVKGKGKVDPGYLSETVTGKANLYVDGRSVKPIVVVPDMFGKQDEETEVYDGQKTLTELIRNKHYFKEDEVENKIGNGENRVSGRYEGLIEHMKGKIENSEECREDINVEGENIECEKEYEKRYITKIHYFGYGWGNEDVNSKLSEFIEDIEKLYEGEKEKSGRQTEFDRTCEKPVAVAHSFGGVLAYELEDRFDEIVYLGAPYEQPASLKVRQECNMINLKTEIFKDVEKKHSKNYNEMEEQKTSKWEQAKEKIKNVKSATRSIKSKIKKGAKTNLTQQDFREATNDIYLLGEVIDENVAFPEIKQTRYKIYDNSVPTIEDYKWEYTPKAKIVEHYANMSQRNQKHLRKILEESIADNPPESILDTVIYLVESIIEFGLSQVSNIIQLLEELPAEIESFTLAIIAAYTGYQKIYTIKYDTKGEKLAYIDPEKASFEDGDGIIVQPSNNTAKTISETMSESSSHATLPEQDVVQDEVEDLTCQILSGS